MTAPLTVTLVQADLHWENPTANRAMFEEMLAELTEPTDLIVLPEMFTTGFTMNPAPVAEVMNLTTTRWMKQMAAQYQAVVTGSFVVQENGKYYNRLLWMEPDGTYDFYDKRHLFRMGNEHELYTAGTRRIIKNWKGWNICPLICYDLRFPVWSRNVDNQYDVLIYTANWPAVREPVWKTLLMARAIENQCYVVGVNRIGEDGNGLAHSGASGLINSRGEWISYPQSKAFIHSYTLDHEELSTFRGKFPVSLDGDKFQIL